MREIGGKKIGESQKSRRAKRTELKSGEGKGGALPPFPVHRSARFAHRFFFLLTKLVYLSFFKAFIHFLFLTLYTLQEFNKTLTADLITSSEEFLV